MLLLFFTKMLLVTPVTIIKVSYNKNTISLRIIVKECMTKPLDVTLDFYSAPYGIKYQINLLKYSKLGCVYVVYWIA
jgi:hypothetical protein